eukprot:12840167-Alexandrium_andersonii.AAC.1
MTSGQQLFDRHVRATKETHEYLSMMGATIAMEKSTNQASDKFDRKRLAGLVWHVNEKQGVIPVIHGDRDLGAHLCTSARFHGATLTKRIHRMMPVVTRLGRIPTS